MGFTVTTDIFCDKCGHWTPGVSSSVIKVTESRELARRRGWMCPKKKSEFQKDLCPMCAGTATHRLSDGSYVLKDATALDKPGGEK